MSSDYRLMQQRIEFNLDLDATLLDRTYTIVQSTVAEGKYIDGYYHAVDSRARSYLIKLQQNLRFEQLLRK